MNQAACRALEQAKEKNIKKLVLYTDSKFTINGELHKMDPVFTKARFLKHTESNSNQSFIHPEHVSGQALKFLL